MATGRKINTGQDNPVMLAIAQKLSGNIRGLEIANLNVSSSTGFFNVAEGSLSNVGNTLGQLRDLAVQAADSTLSPSARSAINDQANGLLQELNRVSGSSNFNGVNLLDGTFGNKTLQVGPNEGDTLSVSLDSASATALGVDSIDLGNATTAGNAITTIDAAITQIQTQRASVGSNLQKLEGAYTANTTTIENYTAARSVYQDLDYAKATSDLIKEQIQQQALSLVFKQNIKSERSRLSLLV